MENSISEVAQSCPTLCDPMDSSLPGSRSMGFSRQEYRIGLPFPSPGDLPNPGIEHGPPELQTDALPSEMEGPYKTKNRTTIRPSNPTIGSQVAPGAVCRNLGDNLFSQLSPPSWLGQSPDL